MAVSRLHLLPIACVLLLLALSSVHAESPPTGGTSNLSGDDHSKGPKAALTTAGVMGVVAAIVGCCFLMGIAIVVGCNKAQANAKHAAGAPHGAPHPASTPHHVAHAAPPMMMQVPHPTPVLTRMPPTPVSSNGYGYAGAAPIVALDSGAMALGSLGGSPHGSYIVAPQSPTTWVSDPASPTPLIVKQEYIPAPIYTYGGQAGVPMVQFQ